MLKTIAKAVGYTKAPKRTFAVLHPRAALKLGALLLTAKLVVDRVRAHRS
jgi:hypothetical protein